MKALFIDSLRMASKLLRAEIPQPRISRTVDMYPNLSATERAAEFFSEIKALPTRTQTAKQHFDKILAIRNYYIETQQHHLVHKANKIIRKWTPLINQSLTGTQHN